MKQLVAYICISIIAISVSSCKKSDLNDIELKKDENSSDLCILSSTPSLGELEQHVRKLNDFKPTFTYQQYRQLLNEIIDERFIVLPLNEFKDSINDEKVMICLRHDVDHHPFKALEMARIEHEYGFRATFYMLGTAVYSGIFHEGQYHKYACMSKIYSDIDNLGSEIGIHNDLLTVMIKYKLEPYAFNKSELIYFNNIGIDIFGTAAHGSTIAKETVPNYQMFSDFAQSTSIDYKGESYNIGERSLSEYGYQYEAYFINNNKYFSDVGGKWNLPGGFDQLIQEIRNSVPGDRIQILTHPVWWK